MILRREGEDWVEVTAVEDDFSIHSLVATSAERLWLDATDFTTPDDGFFFDDLFALEGGVSRR